MDPEVEAHVHESPKSMTIPLVILALLSVVGGFVGIPHVLGGANRFETFLEPVFSRFPHGGGEVVHHAYPLSVELGLMFLAVLVALSGIYIAYRLYVKEPEKPGELADKYPGLYQAVLNKYYVDEIYFSVIIIPLYRISLFLWEWFDTLIIDGIVNGIGKVFLGFGQLIRRLQTGFVQNYAFSLLLGVVLMLGYFLFG
jgi:NADH-quinone oxidoreductase subunit L